MFCKCTSNYARVNEKFMTRLGTEDLRFFYGIVIIDVCIAYCTALLVVKDVCPSLLLSGLLILYSCFSLFLFCDKYKMLLSGRLSKHTLKLRLIGVSVLPLDEKVLCII